MLVNNNLITVVAVDDHSMITHGIEHILVNHPNVNIVAHGRVGDDVLTLVEKHKPDVLILDLNMPQSHNDNEAQFQALPTIATLLRLHRDLAIIILSNYYIPTILQGAVELGVRGYFLKSDLVEIELPSAIVKVSKGGIAFSGTVERNLFGNMAQNKTMPQLTPRHIEVLSLLAVNADASNAQIGEQLGITENTVKRHVSSIFVALGVANRTAAVIRAAQLGIVSIRHI